MKLGDIFWDLAPVIYYSPGYDIGCTIYVANPTDSDKEYALTCHLNMGGVLIEEEPILVYGYTWFPVHPGEYIRLNGNMSFSQTNAILSVELVEKETEGVASSVSTRLVAPSTTGVLPPSWQTPGTAATTTGFDLSSMMNMIMMIMMMGMMMRIFSTGR